MAHTPADLTAVEAAIASGALTVEMPDGRRITYRSIDDLLRAKASIVADLTASGAVSLQTRPRTSLMYRDGK